jgi:LPXTG-motif cell wall-anchored protein
MRLSPKTAGIGIASVLTILSLSFAPAAHAADETTFDPYNPLTWPVVTPYENPNPACDFITGIKASQIDLSLNTLLAWRANPQDYFWHPYCDPAKGIILPTGWTWDDLIDEFGDTPDTVLNVLPRETPAPIATDTHADTTETTPGQGDATESDDQTPADAQQSGDTTNTNQTNTNVNIDTTPTPANNSAATPAVLGASTTATTAPAPTELPKTGGSDTALALATLIGSAAGATSYLRARRNTQKYNL